MLNKPLISIVTPCYNEELNVEQQHAAVQQAIKPFRTQYDFEFIYTDNCSEDGTFALLNKLALQNPDFKALRFSRNLGADRAIFIALKKTRGAAVIIIQADLQDPPELIPEFIKGYEQGFDVVYGKIKKRDGSLLMRFMRKIYYRLIAAMAETQIPRNAGEFRLMSRRALDALLQFEEQNIFIRGAVAAIGFKQIPIEYKRRERAAGKTSTNFYSLLSYALNSLLATSMVPLRLVTIAGIILSAVGFLLTLWVVAGKIIFPDAAPHGFSTLAFLLAFFSGVQILALGIIGEYLRKVYVQTLDRPKGFIQDALNFEK